MEEVGAPEADGDLRVLAQADDDPLGLELPAAPARDPTGGPTAHRSSRRLCRHHTPPFRSRADRDCGATSGRGRSTMPRQVGHQQTDPRAAATGQDPYAWSDCGTGLGYLARVGRPCAVLGRSPPAYRGAAAG